MSQQILVEYPLNRPLARDNPLARGADGVLRYGNLTPALTELLDLQVHAFSNREAVVELGGPRLTYRELWHSASRIAGGLQEHGIGYGDRVAVHLPVGVRWVRSFLGALLSGAVPVLVDHALPGPVAERVIADAGADFVLGDGDADLPDGAAFIDDGAALGDLALLCYTSGTRRGVELTNENLLSAIRSVVGALDLPADGLRNLVLLPLAHASGCVDQLLPTFAVGGTVVLAPDTGRLAEALVTERIDMVSGTPRLFAGLLPHLAALRGEGLDTARVRRISNAGHRTPVPAESVTALRDAFPEARQWSVWGATETSGIGLAVDDTVAQDDSATVLGFPFGGTELALWGPRAELGCGELLCRGPNVTRRYWNDPEATAHRFTGTWFHTGDQVRIGADGLVRRETA
ncbi:long-chain fatty acid--CoA ligase [Nocardia puris]|uniref:Acyl-CoA synthetase (AMP-forming)/AMP-acid ligase II n=1 Tax=Nocardia puris TaxID=208602 RepID=A0A366DR84_9NOCA|nr:long-chain fatty acid--CoA ligase [Nocardia puris]MBF6210919.1 long-chain fatty acid--CoA ligase [Nocardia puris]MBF6364514.1 long-chain fatty acid--CoA ligase [Nocardia puris]MBF6459443.1 long-chain fatty acid--CoA ligase [Nocardia puris]RBO92596.1 acyl-CoA synthetase (AMP-forming)/AMP-acid ligase II [Nocardia puris]